MERLQKVIAASGIASRREAERLISEGKVRVNSALVTEQGVQVDPAKDTITVLGRPLPTVQSVVYAVYKPRGYVTSTVHQGKDVKEKIVTELVPTYPPVYPVGRLDKESEGLLLLTNNGELTHKLTHPSFEHPKEYRVSCTLSNQSMDIQGISRKLLAGVKLGDGLAKADAVTVTRHTTDQVELRITVHEGRHHLLRRMCATLGLKVTRLTRVKIGTLSLEKLRPGQYRTLAARDVQSLV